jgi:hypothetical protein
VTPKVNTKVEPTNPSTTKRMTPGRFRIACATSLSCKEGKECSLPLLRLLT